MKKRTWIVLLLLLCAAMTAFAGCAMAEAAPAEEKIDIPVIDNMKKFEIPDNEAMRFVAEMKTGWDLGNTFDAYDDQGWFKGAEPTMETAWHGVTTSRELIAAIKAAGFNTIRIPVSWHNHVDKEYTINAEWLERVKEVTGWAVEEGMYAIVNVHHDNDLKFFFPDSAHYDQSAAYLGKIWQQMAEAFAEFDDHVILESMNEPRLVGDSALEWSFNPSSPKSQDAADCINRLNQLFVDTVRASGGNNATRYLAVPGYAASPAGVTNDYFKLPEDTADNRIIIEVHAYTPYDFALNQGAGSYSNFALTDAGKISQIGMFMNDLYKKYVSQGIPVVIDEYGAMEKKGNLQDRVNFAAYYICAASARGMTCCWWDNCAFTGNGERFGIIDRKTCEWRYPEIVEAIMANCLYNR